MTLSAETGDAPLSKPGGGPAERPVEYWPTTAIRSALEAGDITVWQKIVVAIKRDPFGRTARQVEEVLDDAPSQGITNALAEVLYRDLKGNQHMSLREDLELYLEGRVSPPVSLVIRIRKLSDRFARVRAQRTEDRR